MTTFVLVHGGWAGGWVWEEIIPRVEAAGHRALAPDLPGHGGDTTPPTEITLDTYVDALVEVIDAAPQPVVLVGHSSGGVIVTQTAERRPDRIRLLVYVCAYLPRDGQTLLELGQTDPDQLLLPNLVFAEDATTVTIAPAVVGEALFADCPDAEGRFAARARPEPLAAASTPVKVTDDAYGRVPRAYVVCTRDRALSTALQRRMVAAVPCNEVVEMDTGHMPMYAAPGQLASHLVALADA